MPSPGKIVFRHLSIPSSFFRFVLVGVLVLLVENFLVWLLLLEWGNYVVVRGIATGIAVILSYVLNTRFSFSSSHSFRRFISYVSGVSLSVIVSYVVSLGVYFMIFAESHPLLSVNIGACVAALTNFLYQNYITYSKEG